MNGIRKRKIRKRERRKSGNPLYEYEGIKGREEREKKEKF